MSVPFHLLITVLSDSTNDKKLLAGLNDILGLPRSSSFSLVQLLSINLLVNRCSRKEGRELACLCLLLYLHLSSFIVLDCMCYRAGAQETFIV